MCANVNYYLGVPPFASIWFEVAKIIVAISSLNYSWNTHNLYSLKKSYICLMIANYGKLSMF